LARIDGVVRQGIAGSILTVLYLGVDQFNARQ